MFEDIGNLMATNMPAQPAPMNPMQSTGPTMGQMFGNPGQASSALMPQPAGIDTVKRMGEQKGMNVPTQTGNSAQDRADLITNLQNKYGPDYMKNPDALKLLAMQQASGPISKDDSASLTMQGKRTLDAIQKVGM